MAEQQSDVKGRKYFFLVLLVVACLAGFSVMSSMRKGRGPIPGEIFLDTARTYMGSNNVDEKGLAPPLKEPQSGDVGRHGSTGLTGQTESSSNKEDKKYLPPSFPVPEVTSITANGDLTDQSGSSLPLDVDKPIWGPTSTGLKKLPWTSIYGKHEKDSFHFFSAYYDDRTSAPGRPAVLVLGYSYDAIYNQRVALYCVFKYLNGTSTCRSAPATDRHPNTCYTPSLGAKPRHYICGMNANEEPPIYVQLSNSSRCEPEFTSAEIPVRNRHHAKPTKKFGICISGPLIQESRRILQDLIQFIELSQLMGAEFIIMYANETQIDEDILEYLWEHYPGVVRTIGWKRFKKWNPLHYFGQLMLMSDCLYQVMYEVENLAMMDIDEMIVPVKHNNWGEMINSFKVQPGTMAFRFQNAFFDDPDPSATAKFESEINKEDPFRFIPKYFTHTRRYRCTPYQNYMTKVIDHPKFIVEPAIHSVCKSVADHKVTHLVPENTGFLAHYRHPVPDECKFRPTHTDRTLDKFKDTLNKKIFTSSGKKIFPSSG